MLYIGVILAIVTLVKTQINPTWIESPYVEARTVTLVNNAQKTSGEYFQNITYSKALTNPTIALSVTNIRIVSNAGTIGYKIMISDPSLSDKFEQKTIITSPTVVWNLAIRFFAYQQTVNMLGDHLQVTLFDQPTAVVNAGRGIARSETVQQNIASVNINHRFLIGTFMVGYQGDSPDYYQANITSRITVANKIDITINVASNTQISQIYIYVIIADLTTLQIQSRIFVQLGLTQSSYGTQYSTFTPSEGYFAGNYISGMLSFSMRDNFEYNLTVVTGFLFQTLSSSKYNTVSHFNLYGRQCASPYDYFRKTNHLCYVTCPGSTYIVQEYSLCDPCHYSCATCTQAATCNTCQPNRHIPSALLCVCKDYFYENSQICQSCHYSCQTCTDDQYIHCLTCQSTMKRSILTTSSINKTCPCITGYYDVQLSRCNQICGDGVIYEDACDDGNTNDDDGCSSLCVIQTYFRCDASAPSKCYYNANPVLTVIKVDKTITKNEASIYLKIQPYIPAMSGLKAANFELNFTYGSMIISQVGQYTVLKFSYIEDIQNITSRISFVPDNTGSIFSTFNASNLTVQLQATDGQRLQYYQFTTYQSCQALETSSIILSSIILGTALLFCWKQWKQLGNQLFFVIQFAFLSYTATPYFTPYTVAISSTKHVMGYNGIFGQPDTPDLAQRKMQFMGYSVAYHYNYNIMLILPIIALILYGLYRLFLYIHIKKIRQAIHPNSEYEFEQTKLGKVFSLFQFDFFVYWVLISMQQIIVGTVLQTQDQETPVLFVFAAICLVGVIVSIIAIFIKPKSMKAYRRVLFHRHYGDKTFIIVLISILVMDALLLMSVLVNTLIFYVLLVFPLAIIIYVIVQRPFKSMSNNIRLIFIEACLLTILVLQVITINTTKSVFLMLPIGYLCLICLAWLVTIVVWIYLLYIKCRKDQYVIQTDYSSQKQEEVMQDKFKHASYLMFNQTNNQSDRPNLIYQMKQIESKNNNSRLASARTRMQTPRQYPSNFKPEKQTERNKSLSKGKLANNNSESNITKKANKIQMQNDSIQMKQQDTIRNLTSRSRNNNNRSQLRSPMSSSRVNGIRASRSNIYQDILESNVSRYK